MKERTYTKSEIIEAIEKEIELATDRRKKYLELNPTDSEGDDFHRDYIAGLRSAMLLF